MPSGGPPLTTPALAVRPVGELDISDCPGLSDRLAEALELSADVTLDLSEVTFVDSTILSVLVKAHSAARSRGATLRIVGAHGLVARVLRITRLDQALDIS